MNFIEPSGLKYGKKNGIPIPESRKEDIMLRVYVSPTGFRIVPETSSLPIWQPYGLHCLICNSFATDMAARWA